MTKFELMKMLEDVDDNAELTFVAEGRDHDGYPEDNKVKVYKVLGGKVVKVRGKYGIRRYETLTEVKEAVRH